MTESRTITVAQTAPFYANEREEAEHIIVKREGDRYFYVPDHIGDVLANAAQVIAVTDHECTVGFDCGGVCGREHSSDECCVDEIDLPNYVEES